MHNDTPTGGPYTVTVNNSQISSNTSTIWTASSAYTVRIGASQLIGNGGQGPGTYLCIFSYNGSYAALGANTY